MVTVNWEGSAYRVRDGESVLGALVRGGANIPFSCKKGSCGCCLLRSVEGHVTERATRGLRPSLIESGHFKPCVCEPTEDLSLAPPDLAQGFVEARLAARTRITQDVHTLDLEPEVALGWRPGQYVNVRRPDGAARSYSICSIEDEDYFLRLTVRRVHGGEVSPWLTEEIEIGDHIEVQGPLGRCTYDDAFAGRRLRVVATGVGVAPMVGMVRDALRSGHDAPIAFYAGARALEDLADVDVLRSLALQHPQLEVHFAISDEIHAPFVSDVHAGWVTEFAFEDEDLSGDVLFLCGSPDMVFDARRLATLHGIRRADVRADPFECAHPYEPEDREKIAAIEPDLELWAALGRGQKLTEILEDFYTRVYDDPRLAPFFHNATKDRAIEKQFSFLRDLITGERRFFGLRPFNAHHWMIISDELFDYREDLFEGVLRNHGLAEPLIRRWMALHETFRREIVKSSPRGLIIDGVERRLEGYAIEKLEIDMVCDGCTGEMHAGEEGRLHRRTGQLYCSRCAARSVAS